MFAVACGEDSVIPTSETLPDGSLDVEASTDAGATAALDGASDAPDAGPKGTVTVLIEDRLPAVHVPVQGQAVVFYDTTGTIVLGTTGADGRASALVHAGATITVVWRQGDYTEIMSVVGVGLGETIDVTYEPIGLAPRATLDFQSVAPPGVADGVEYRFFDGQGGSGGAFVPNPYTRDTDFPLVDGTGFRLLGFAPATFAPSITPTKYAVGVVPKSLGGATSHGAVVAADWAAVENGPLVLAGTAPSTATTWGWDLGQANVDGLYPMLHVDSPPASAALPASYARVPTFAAADVIVVGTLGFGASSRSVRFVARRTRGRSRRISPPIGHRSRAQRSRVQSQPRR